ncbi:MULTISPECIES: pyridoxal-phosphate dependent enzyme [unclassified Streptomyces]|uniref:pyridoxal-phosphate dependent enzyme n=1 Tax=unclassified Streptomyces TaxID=2593676 RepID=UPI0036F036EA
MAELSNRVVLGSWPTPVEPAPRLAAAIGLGPEDLFVKRDDLTGLGAGGNKVRKLEWTVGAAIAGGATALVTSGAAQSNHARLTAAAAARLGLEAVLVLAGRPAADAGGNITLQGLLGARLVWAGDVDGATLERTVRDVAHHLDAHGRTAAVIPFGGTDVRATRGYVLAGRELMEQVPDVEHVVTAVGSGGTMAGLVGALGRRRVLGVDCGAVPDAAETVDGLLTAMPEKADGTELRLRGDQVGTGYGALQPAVLEAITLCARTEGIVLDPVYTGRALAGLVAAVREGDIRPGRRTVLLHSGGLPGLFGHPEAVREASTRVVEASLCADGDGQAGTGS